MHLLHLTFAPIVTDGHEAGQQNNGCARAPRAKVAIETTALHAGVGAHLIHFKLIISRLEDFPSTSSLITISPRAVNSGGIRTLI